MASSFEGNVGRGRQRTTRPIDRSLKRSRAFRDDGRIATLLKGLPRNYDGPSLTAIVDAIEATITLYHQHTNPSLERHRELVSDAINARLSEIHDAAAKLADALLAIDGDPQLVLRNRSGGKCPDLANLLGLLDELAECVAVKRESRRRKRGPTLVRRAFVVQIICLIEGYMGSKVERSAKRGTPAEVLREIVAIMDPDIGDGTINEALKTRSKERGEIKRPKQ